MEFEANSMQMFSCTGEPKEFIFEQMGFMTSGFWIGETMISKSGLISRLDLNFVLSHIFSRNSHNLAFGVDHPKIHTLINMNHLAYCTYKIFFSDRSKQTQFVNLYPNKIML